MGSRYSASSSLHTTSPSRSRTPQWPRCWWNTIPRMFTPAQVRGGAIAFQVLSFDSLPLGVTFPVTATLTQPGLVVENSPYLGKGEHLDIEEQGGLTGSLRPQFKFARTGVL